MKNKGMLVFGILILLGMMFIPITTVFAESDSTCAPEEVQWTVYVRVTLTGGNTSGTVTVWAISGSQAEERGKQKWLDENPRYANQVVSISANATRR